MGGWINGCIYKNFIDPRGKFVSSIVRTDINYIPNRITTLSF